MHLQVRHEHRPIEVQVSAPQVDGALETEADSTLSPATTDRSTDRSDERTDALHAYKVSENNDRPLPVTQTPDNKMKTLFTHYYILTQDKTFGTQPTKNFQLLL